MYKILPSILTSNYLNLKENISALHENNMDEIHLDIMDGNFVPSITFGDKLVKDIHDAFPNLSLDVHLMAKNPMRLIDSFIKAGATTITVHIETITKGQLYELSKLLKDKKINLGLAIGHKTKIEKCFNVLKSVDIDQLLIMSVQEGAGGQQFDNDTYAKIERINTFKNKYNKDFILEVDGGINETNFKDLIDSKVEKLVIGNSIFKSTPIEANYKKFLSK